MGKHRSRSRSRDRSRDRSRKLESSHKLRNRSRSRDRDKNRNISKDRDRDRDYHKRNPKKEVKEEPSSEYESRRRSRSPNRIKDGGSKDRDRKHKNKKRDRDSSSSSTSSAESSADEELNRLLDKERSEKLKQKRLAKLKLKEKETPEQKRVRRLAKKLRKEEKRRVNSLPDVVSYTNLNNPFNDAQLTETFVWKKKLEVEGKGNLSKKEIERMNREKVRKNYEEMERLKRDRDARQALKEDMEMISRDKDRQQSDFRQTEEKFNMYQAKLRSKIRIKEGRPKPIDLLARYIGYEDPDNEWEEFELDEPLTYLKKCSISDFEDLLEDIQVYQRIEGKKNQAFWADIVIVINSELKKLRDRRRAGLEEVVHSSVQDEVLKIFKAKTYEELANLERSIQARINNAGKGIDVSYWESLLESLHPFMAKARLREKHGQLLQLKLKRIREEQMLEMDKHQAETGQVGPSTVAKPAPLLPKKPEPKPEKMEVDEEHIPTKAGTVEMTEEDERLLEIARKKLPFTVEEFEKIEEEHERDKKWDTLNEYQVEAFALEMYNLGGYSPTYGGDSDAMPGIDVFLEEEDEQRLFNQRLANRKGGYKPLDAKEDAMFKIAKQGMNNDEAAFSVEQDLGEQTLLWSDKYRPQKPKYFNRVHTGFDWNKYNQTHYDVDNPPPKVVQGYRFNIFYPDLLDPTKTPRFVLQTTEDPEFAIIRFIAGPPYEDIAFKIVNREWEINHKHGYKCQFSNGVFQLWFFFKRYRYRR